MSNNMNLQGWLKAIYVAFAFCSAFFLGALKGILVGPIASLILIIGNSGVILGMFPSHVYWTVYTLVKTNRFDTPLKVAILFALPALFGLWLGLSIAGSVLVGVGYGFFTPWVSAFEAFRHDNESKKFYHCIVDGTWGTIKGSCTMVTDFADMSLHSFPIYLKELRESPYSKELQTLRFVHVPGCIIVAVMGLVVDIPLYTIIAIAKSPYMLFKGWFRLLHDLISREGPFLETACIPIAGLAILFWPIVVIGSVIVAIVSSVFIGLYGSVIVYQSLMSIQMIGSISGMGLSFQTRPRYRKKKASQSSELPVGQNRVVGCKFNSVPTEAPAMLMPSLAHSRSVREAIQEVKMVQIWVNMMKSCETRGKELLDAGLITSSDLYEWLKAKNANEAAIISVGLPCYSLLHTIMYSIEAESGGLLLLDNVEVNYLNRPKDKLVDWFFNPVMVLKEQIRVIKLEEGEVRYLKKVVLFGSNAERRKAWENSSFVPEDALRAAQIEGISRRMIGMIRSVSKFPTYRRRFRQVVKSLISYSEGEAHLTTSNSTKSISSIENV